MNIPEQVEKEIDDMCSSLEKGKIDIEKKFKSLLDDFISESWQHFDYNLEQDSRYQYKRWIRETCEEIINGLLSGDTRYLKDRWIISEYDWEKLNKVRLAIWESSGQDIEGCLVRSLQKEIEELKKENKRLRSYI